VKRMQLKANLVRSHLPSSLFGHLAERHTCLSLNVRKHALVRVRVDIERELTLFKCKDTFMQYLCNSEKKTYLFIRLFIQCVNILCSQLVTVQTHYEMRTIAIKC